MINKKNIIKIYKLLFEFANMSEKKIKKIKSQWDYNTSEGLYSQSIKTTLILLPYQPPLYTPIKTPTTWCRCTPRTFKFSPSSREPLKPIQVSLISHSSNIFH